MRPVRRAGKGILLALLLALPASAPAVERLAVMDGWQFHLGEIPASPPFDVGQAGWQAVMLPHDWSIGLPRSAEVPTEGAGGFFPTGIGCYQKRLQIPAGWAGKTVWIHFEGIARVAHVWLNGHPIGEHVNPYTPARFDLTPFLDAGGDNVLSVVVDNSAEPASRWYVGSGIYRPVHLEAAGAVHVTHGGLFARTGEIDGTTARLLVGTAVANTGDEPVEAVVEISLAGPGGAAAPARRTIPIAGKSTTEAEFAIEVADARVWSPEQPELYRLEYTVSVDGREVDRGATRTGIRTVGLCRERGLLLNGEPVKLMGCNIHHDYGILGAAVHPEGALRKARQIKQAGFNAVRTAHNPPSTAFLDACDQVGLLVMDEAFDTWKVAKMKQDYHQYFEANWRADLDTFVRRDRNHPCVVMWSIGNEMYDRGKAYAPALSAEMAAHVKRLDPTRPVTAGINGLGGSGEWSDLDPLFATLDIAGYNYELHRHAEDRARVPGRLIIATETYLADALDSWRFVTRNHYVIGEFIWTGIDYLGEAAIGRWYAWNEEVRQHWQGLHYPWHGAACGDIDLIGARRPISHYRNILWDRGERLYMAVEIPGPDGKPWQPSAWSPPPLQASWTWPGHEGRQMTVEVYSRHDAVRLTLNGEVVGEQATSAETGFKAVFTLPYRPGVLAAEGLRDGGAVQSFSLRTAGAPDGLWLGADKRLHRAGARELIFVEVQVVDKDLQSHPAAELPVRYALSGPAEITGIGSGDLTTTETYTANPRRTYQGRALVAIRTTGAAGDIRLTASAPGLRPATITILSR